MENQTKRKIVHRRFRRTLSVLVAVGGAAVADLPDRRLGHGLQRLGTVRGSHVSRPQPADLGQTCWR